MTEIKLTKEAILRAAKTCPDAERVLKELAPECFDICPVWEVARTNSGCALKVSIKEQKYWVWLDKPGWNKVEDICGEEHIATSPDEYFRKKFAGEL